MFAAIWFMGTSRKTHVCHQTYSNLINKLASLLNFFSSKHILTLKGVTIDLKSHWIWFIELLSLLSTILWKTTSWRKYPNNMFVIFIGKCFEKISIIYSIQALDNRKTSFSRFFESLKQGNKCGLKFVLLWNFSIVHDIASPNTGTVKNLRITSLTNLIGRRKILNQREWKFCSISEDTIF